MDYGFLDTCSISNGLRESIPIAICSENAFNFFFYYEQASQIKGYLLHFNFIIYIINIPPFRVEYR